MQTIKPGFRVGKKKLLIIIAAVIVVAAAAAGAGFWLRQQVETGATASISNSKKSVSSSLKALDTKLADTKLSSKDRLAAFGELGKALTNIDKDICKNESKNITFAVSKAKNMCDDAHKKLLTTRTAVQKIEDGVKDDQALSATLVPIKTADASNPAKQLEAWTTIGTNISKAEVSNDAMKLKNHLLAIANAYKTAWQELIDADKAQNKTNYEAAIKKLDAAKEELGKAATEQTTAFKSKLTDLKEAVASFK